MGQIELVLRVPPWKTEPTTSQWHLIPFPPPSAPHTHTHAEQATPLLLQGQESALRERGRGPLSSDITLLLEMAAPYDCCVVWPGLSTSPRKACRLGEPG